MVPVGPKFGFRERAVRPWRYQLGYIALELRERGVYIE
jgi:hypothetical protein